MPLSHGILTPGSIFQGVKIPYDTGTIYIIFCLSKINVLTPYNNLLENILKTPCHTYNINTSILTLCKALSIHFVSRITYLYILYLVSHIYITASVV